ncbi:MAG: AI-2E family transporter [Vicinamibacterales bacterium]
MSDSKPRFASEAAAEDAKAPPKPVLEPRAAGEGPLVPIPVDVRSAAVTIIAVIAAVMLLQYAQPVLIPLVLGLLLSYALDPVVIRLARAHIPRPIGAALVLLIATSGSGVLLYQLRFQVQAIVQDLPDGARRFRRVLESQRTGEPSTIEKVQQAATELEKAADATGSTPPPRPGVTRVQVEAPPLRVSDYLVPGFLRIAGIAGQALLVLFLAYFLLASGDLYRRKLVKIVGPSLTKKRITLQILQEIDHQIESFLLVQVFTSVVVAVASWLVFESLGLEQAAVWGVGAGIFNSIPYVGPVIVSGGTAIVAFLQFGTLEMTLIVSGASVVITSLEGFLLTPWLTSRAAHMNAVAVFVGLLFFGWVWNVWGLLLAVPMLMVIKAVCDHVEDFRAVGELLGE